MYKRMCKDMFKEENYIKALAYFSKKFINCKSDDEAERLFEKWDWKIFEYACGIDETDQALCIISGLQIAVDELIRELRRKR